MLTIPLSLALIAVALILVISHIRAWRVADHGGLAEVEREFQSLRFRRRLQTSAMLGVIGLLMLGELWLDKVFKDELPRLMYWSGVGLLLLWLLLLAASDWLASRQHYRGQLERLQTDRDALRGELERMRREHREMKDNRENKNDNDEES